MHPFFKVCNIEHPSYCSFPTVGFDTVFYMRYIYFILMCFFRTRHCLLCLFLGVWDGGVFVFLT